jgi:hypothetical protein
VIAAQNRKRTTSIEEVKKTKPGTAAAGFRALKHLKSHKKRGSFIERVFPMLFVPTNKTSNLN